MRRVMITVLSFILIVSCLSSCVGKDIANNNLDTKKFLTYYKQDSNANFGKKACVFKDRIYYFSNEKGLSGIYSMDRKGGDVKTELEVQDIRKLQLTENGIFFCGFKDFEANQNGKNRVFDLLFKDSTSDNTVSILDQERYKDIKNLNGNEKNIWDFYYVDPSLTIVENVEATIPTSMMGLQTFCISNNGVIENEQYTVILEEKKMQNPLAESMFCISEINELIISSRESPSWQAKRYVEEGKSSHSDRRYVIDNADVSVLDIDNNLMVLGDNRLFPVYKFKNRMLRSLNARGLIVTVGNEISLLDMNTLKFINQANLSDTADILFLLDTGEFAYIISETEKGNQGIYAFNLDTFASTNLMNFDKGEKVLWLDTHQALVLSGATVGFYRIDNEICEKISSIELDRKIDSKEYKTDVAGNWLFVYKFDSKLNADILQYKINIETGEYTKI